MTKKLWVRGAQPAEDFDQAVISPLVAQTLQKWVAATRNGGGVLIGDIALAFYARPRFVNHIETFYLDHASVPKSVSGFLRRSSSELVDKQTKTVLRTIVAAEIGLRADLATRVYDSTVSKGGMVVTSLHGLIALKLHFALSNRRGAHRHAQDIIDMIIWSPDFELPQMDWWGLQQANFTLLAELHDLARTSG